MGAPQIIILTLMGLGLLIGANQHGKPRPNYDFWSILLATAINFGLLYWGGFFS